jgi:hypothetical protein
VLLLLIVGIVDGWLFCCCELMKRLLAQTEARREISHLHKRVIQDVDIRKYEMAGGVVRGILVKDFLLSDYPTPRFLPILEIVVPGRAFMRYANSRFPMLWERNLSQLYISARRADAQKILG